MMTELLSADFYALLVLCINLITTISYLFIINNVKAKEGFYRLPLIIQKFYVLLFVLPLFISPFLTKVTFLENSFIKIVGIILSLIGILFILFSFLKIGVVPSISKSGLITTGMYRIVRHPIYSGTLVLFLGLILFHSSALSLLYFPLSILLYWIMTYFEERDLIRMFGEEYILYKQKVKSRIIPFVI
jgi:protein-S-isoprenylcysteine O-methyltransferase Ste14